MGLKFYCKRSIVFSMLLFGLFLSVTSCDEDENNGSDFASSLPKLSRLGIAKPLSITEYGDASKSQVQTVSSFNYVNDKVYVAETETGDDKDTMTVSQNPLSISYVHPDATESYFDFLTNELGCATKISSTSSLPSTSEFSATYDDEGHLLSYKSIFKDYIIEIEFTWKNGNLIVIYMNSRFTDDYLINSSYTCTFEYGSDLNNGLFIAEKESNIPLLFLYSGLYGKTSVNLPVSCEKEFAVFCNPDSYSYKYEYTFNEDKSVSSYIQTESNENKIKVFEFKY